MMSAPTTAAPTAAAVTAPVTMAPVTTAPEPPVTTILGTGPVIAGNPAVLSLVTPVRFDGGDAVDVEDFLDTLELSFPMLDQQVAAEKRERVRVLALQGLLDDKAREFWSSLRREKKATFQLAAAALRERFPPDREDDASEWTVKLRAWGSLSKEN